jgi:predicted nucleic acid-binding protein
LLSLVGTGAFEICVSVPLVLEYEEIAKRHALAFGLADEDIDDVLDYLCQVADRRRIHFLWRPYLKDLEDDMILELAVEAECSVIVTHNVRDFAGLERFGIRAIGPRKFLREIGAIP